MKVKMKPVIGCAVSVAAISMFTSMAAFAATDTEWSYHAVADVNTEVNIRAGASTESEIVGYLPKAAVAEVIERGEEWTHIISGNVEGYVKDEYLAYGDDAKRLASVYGFQGVEISWDDVNMFSEPDGCSTVVNTADCGEEFTLLEQQGLWYAVLLDDSSVAYVPAEDVQETTILEKAVAVKDDYVVSGDTAASSWQTEYTDDTSYTDTSVSTDTSAADDAVYTDTSATDGNYTDTAVADSYSEAESASAAASDSGAEESSSSDTTASTVYSDDVSLLAALIYCEAGNQSREGKVAVGAVVMNRVSSSLYPGSISSVIYQSGQFLPAGTGWLDQVVASGAPSDCYEAAQAAINGENPVPGALYFNTSAGTGTLIGAHWFY